MKRKGSDVGGVRVEAELRKLRRELARVTRQSEILRASVGKNLGSVKDRYKQIEGLDGVYSVTELCKVLEVSRSGYYQWRDRRPSQRAVEDQVLLAEIKKIFWKHRGFYGSPRVTAALRRLGFHCNHKRVERLMREHQLQGRSRRRTRPQTTNSQHGGPIAPFLLEGGRRPTAVDQIWVTDITYLPTRDGWAYLAAVMDLFSRRILGWSVKGTLGAGLPLEALEQAMARRGEVSGVIHHSDRGCQYASRRYREALDQREFCRSMCRQGIGCDNGAMESFWSTMKAEMRLEGGIRGRFELGLIVYEYIEVYYNEERAHSALGFRSPMEFEVGRGFSN